MRNNAFLVVAFIFILAASAVAQEKPFQIDQGTEVKLMLASPISSGTSIVGDTVPFEVTEDVLVRGLVVVHRGDTAMGTVNEAQPKRRMGRRGKLSVSIDYVRLANGDKCSLSGSRKSEGTSPTTGMAVGITTSALLFWPAAPFFLLEHGSDVVVHRGTSVSAYVSGDMRLHSSDFFAFGQQPVPTTPVKPTPSDESVQFVEGYKACGKRTFIDAIKENLGGKSPAYIEGFNRCLKAKVIDGQDQPATVVVPLPPAG